MSLKYKPLSDLDDDGLQALIDDSTSSESESSTCCSRRVVRIPSRYVSLLTVSLPLGAFIFSVFWAFYDDFRAATLVYCNDNQVVNYLPSLSAAIGDFSVSKTVWIWCVAIHAPSRFFYARMYHKYLTKIIYRRFHVWVNIAILLNVIENIGLLGLSIVSSRVSLPWHSLYFTVFIISSEMYMIITCVLLSWYRNIPCIADREIVSQKWKLRLITTILICSVILPYVYRRHNTSCERGVYTIFALLEYIVVLCNMAFHCTAFWDFYDVMFSIQVKNYIPF